MNVGGPVAEESVIPAVTVNRAELVVVPATVMTEIGLAEAAAHGFAWDTSAGGNARRVQAEANRAPCLQKIQKRCLCQFNT
jgi:hypothetical protein